MNMSTNELQDFMVHKAGLGLNKGTTFGPGGEQHLRLNIGCPIFLILLTLLFITALLPIILFISAYQFS